MFVKPNERDTIPRHLRYDVVVNGMFLLLVMSTLLLGACINQLPNPTAQAVDSMPEDDVEVDVVQETPTRIATEVSQEQASVLYSFTYHNPDGNRWIHGKGGLPDITPLDIPLNDVPLWIVGAPLGEGSLWVVTLEDGRVQAFHVVDGDVNEVAIEPSYLAPTMPPLLSIQDEGPFLITAPDPEASSFTHPVILYSPGSMAYITKSGDLVLLTEAEMERLELSALPDARILKDETGGLLLLNQATDRYGHGVLGDTIEATSMVLIETKPETHVTLEIQIQEPGVIESIAPIWVDINGDGEKEIIVTISDAQQGAQLVVYDEQGNRIATSEPIGRGFRWRHQIAVAPFGPEGERELVSVRTPHIGGVVEFHQLHGDQLRLVANLSGYTSHVLGSRNLDMAAAGDFDGDGAIELLIPDQSMSRLAGIQRTDGGAEEEWSWSLDSTIRTNLAVVTLQESRIGVGVGVKDGFMRLWLP